MALVSDSTVQILNRAKLARKSFEEFVRFVLGFVPAKHQLEWIEALQELADNSHGARLLIVAPPGSGKTTIMVAFMAWMIGRNPEQYHALLSYADQVGWSRSRAIRELMESKYYHIIFPEIEPGTKWGDTSFIVKRSNVGDPHPTLRAGGTNSSVIGARVGGLLIDDPHDQKNSANANQREKIYENYVKTVRTRLIASAWVVVIGTRWAEEDLIGRLMKQKGWKMLTTKALRRTTEGLLTYWPEHYDLAYLENLRYEAPALFALQYMHDTTGGDTGIIRQIRRYYESPQKIIKDMDLVVAAAWDTALKDKQQNDFSVCYIGGLGKDGRVYLLDRIKGRFSLPELLDLNNDIYNEWHPHVVYFEDSAMGTPAIQTLMAELPHIPTMAILASSGGKTPRAHTLSPYLHGGHVLFPAYADWYKDSEYQLTHFPYVDHDDDIDSLYILVTNLINIIHPTQIFNRPDGVSIVMR